MLWLHLFKLEEKVLVELFKAKFINHDGAISVNKFCKLSYICPRLTKYNTYVYLHDVDGTAHTKEKKIILLLL